MLRCFAPFRKKKKGIAYAYDKTRRGSNDYCPATAPDLVSLDIFQRVISIFGRISKKTTGNYVWILGPTRPLIEPGVGAFPAFAANVKLVNF